MCSFSSCLKIMEKKEYALGSLLKIRQGELEKIIRLVADKDYNIVSTVQLATKSGKVVIEVQIDGKVDVEEVRTLFEGAGIQVDSLVPTVAKNI
ncbi:CBS domain protein [Streptococcus suis 05ZYH33]|nr:CBS domain protein [Streptococcus suis 05ZYH33]